MSARPGSGRRTSWVAVVMATLAVAAAVIWFRQPTAPARLRLLTLDPATPSARCEVDGDSREARRLAAGEAFTIGARLPASAVLRYAVAAPVDAPAPPAWRLAIETTDGHPIDTADVRVTRHWTEHTVDLAAFGGREVVLRGRAEGGAICWAAPTVTDGRAGPLVLVILLDTVRADHLQLYGYERATSPALMSLATEAITFTDAASDVSWTRASVATLVTGQPSMVHGVLKRDAPLGDAHPTMAERFRALGFRTVALSTNPNVLPVWGFAGGFDQFVDVDSARWAANSDAARVFAAARTAIEVGGPEPLLLYVHINDAHAPYDPPIATAEALLGTYDRSTPGKNLRVDATAAEIAGAIDRYDAEIAYLDRQIGEFFDFLRTRGLWNDAFVVVVGDHGEEFHDHGGIYHGHTLFREQLHVPLVIKMPGARGGGTRIDDPTSVVDVLPTMLEVIGAPTSDLPGRVLVRRAGHVERGSSLPRFAITDMDHTTVYAVEDDDATLIVQTRPKEEHWLFERRADVTQRRNLAGTDPSRRARLQTVLDERLLTRRRGWHVRVCGAVQQPGTVRLTVATGGTPTTVERVDLEPEDRLEIDDDGTGAALRADLRPQQRAEERFGKLVPRARPDRDELVLAAAPALTLDVASATLPVMVGMSADPVAGPRVTVTLASAATPAVFAPECPGASVIFVWHAGAAETTATVDPAILDRLRAIGYAH